MIKKKTKIYSTLIALVVTTLSACGGEITSQGAEELKALWVVDADRQLQQVRVIARAVEKGVPDTPSVGFGTFDLTPEAESPNDDLFNQFFSFTDVVRLTGKDIMTVDTAFGNHQLYRRSKPLEYQTSFSYDESDTSYELRLDYSAMRYPASVAPVRVFDISNFAVAESGNVVARDGAINVSWNIGDLMTTNDERFMQTMEIDLLSCDSTDITPASISIAIPVNDRAITLLTSQLPDAVNANGSLAATQVECTYGFQLLAHLAPMQDTSTQDTLDTTPAVLIISRSTQQLARVAQ